MPFLFQSAGHKYFEMRILKIKIKAEGWFTTETPLSRTTSVAPLHVKYAGQKQTKHHHLLVSEIFFASVRNIFRGRQNMAALVAYKPRGSCEGWRLQLI